MRRILAILLALWLPVASSAQIIIIAKKKGGGGGGGPTLITSGCFHLGTSGGTTSSLDTTGANFIVGSLTYYLSSSGESEITENKSNGNATKLTLRNTADATRGRLFYWENPTTGSGHTFTFTGTNVFAAICIEAWSGMATSSLFDSGTDAGSNGTATCQPGSISPSAGPKLVIAGLVREGTNTPSIDSGFTISDEIGQIGGAYGAAIAHLVQANGTTVNPTWTLSDYMGCPIAAFNGV